MKIIWMSAIASTTFMASVAGVNAAVFTLYNANGTTPFSQGSLAPAALRSNGSPTLPSELQVMGGGVTLNTAANLAEYSGYSNYNPLLGTYLNPSSPPPPSIFDVNTLNQTAGYSITFTVQLDSAATSNTSGILPRAPFSIIAISSDKKGIEIGFRKPEIFAQSSADFTSQDSAQTAAIDTTSAKTYKLTVFNNTYALTNGGTPIINGALQTYSFDKTASSPPLSFNPYAIESFLFFGDDTGKESGKFTLGSVVLETTSVPFEFSPTCSLLAIGSGLAIKKWRKKAKDKTK